MKLIQELNKGDVKVVIYENTITHNPNPYYTVESFVAGIKQPYNNAGWSLNIATKDAENIFNMLNN